MNTVARGRKAFAGKECKRFDPRRIADTLRIETRSMTPLAGECCRSEGASQREMEQKFVQPLAAKEIAN